jgi:hypothetical protein
MDIWGDRRVPLFDFAQAGSQPAGGATHLDGVQRTLDPFCNVASNPERT